MVQLMAIEKTKTNDNILIEFGAEPSDLTYNVERLNLRQTDEFAYLYEDTKAKLIEVLKTADVKLLKRYSSLIQRCLQIELTKGGKFKDCDWEDESVEVVNGTLV